MSDSSLAQLRRILRLILELADDRPHPIAEVARTVATDRATLLRDIRLLAERYDDPGGFVEGVQVYLEGDRVAVRTSHFLRPMRLTVAELCALELGLSALRAERPPEEHRVIDQARERLRQVIARMPGEPIPEGLRAASVGDPVDPRVLQVLRRAVHARRKVRLTYRRGGDTRSARRTACPYGLVVASGTWYLVAHCERREGLRIFRLDRIEAVEPGEERFERPADFSLEELIREGRAFVPDAPRTLTVRYSSRVARLIAEREGNPPDPDGSLTVERPLADLEWAVRHVLQYGPDAEIVAPEELRRVVAARLSAMTGALPAGQA